MVDTEMAPSKDASPWARASRTEVGRVLLAADGDTMTAGELASALAKDPSNIKKTAKEMVREGLLVSRTPRPATGPGRRPDAAYAFAEGQNEELQRLLAATSASGIMQPGQQLVFVEVVGPQLEDLFHVLGDIEVVAQAAWSALCDGERQEYVVVFDGDSSRPALDLMTALSAAEIRCRRASVVHVAPIDQLAQQARRAARVASQIRLRRQARHASGA
jgi:DNA-binding MarR family transcriptional regulator